MATQGTNHSSTVAAGPHVPDAHDIIEARKIVILASKSRLPIDIVDEILDYACYWLRVTASTDRELRASGGGLREKVFALRTPPICAEVASRTHPFQPIDARRGRLVRKIVWKLKSHDQGWSGEDHATRGTYQCSYTWFDAGIERLQPAQSEQQNVRREIRDFMEAWPDQSPPSTISGSSVATYRPVDPPEHDLSWSSEWYRTSYAIQQNVQAKRDSTEHEVVWSYADDIAPDTAEAEALTKIGRGAASADGKFVRALETGDCVTLWARACFPAWVNTLEEATIEVYFAV